MVAAVLIGAGGLTGCASSAVEVGQDTGVCAANADCADGYICSRSACAKICNVDGDCPTTTQACQEGVCEEVQNPTCTADGDCRTPNACQLDGGAACLGGSCRYVNRARDTPCDDQDPCTENDACDGFGGCAGFAKDCLSAPAGQCSADDTQYIVYLRPGTCAAQSGDCVYEHLELPCPSCQAQCLAPCQGIACDDLHGGCTTHGRCDPLSAPPACEYDAAPDGAPCDLPAAAAESRGGVCLDGACVECDDAGQCRSPPTDYSVCFAAACAANRCVYTVQPAVQCRGALCADGVRYDAAVCGDLGLCPTGVADSCDGFACAPAGDQCRTSCAANADCAGSLRCQANGTCEPPRTTGVPCLASGECSSGICQCADPDCDAKICAALRCVCELVSADGSRCAGPLADGVDDGNGGCGAQTCDGAGGCNLADGAPCDADGHCESNHCSDGVCCDLACDDDCLACNLGGSVGVCSPRSAGDMTECGSCRRCNVAGGDCVAITATDGKGCVDDCSACVSGACVALAVGDAAECPTCQACNAAGNCAPVTGAGGKGCNAAGTFCCAGTCANPPGASSEYGSGCGTGDCAGTWTCSGAAPQCSKLGQRCDYCARDVVYTGTCSGDAYGTGCASVDDGECEPCVTCVDGGQLASCVGFYARGADDAIDLNTCSGASLACDGAGLCKRDLGVACPNGDSECASGRCVDGVCCDRACGGDCDSCALPGSLGRCTPSQALCTGNCDVCDDGGACVASPALCTGNCDACVGSGTAYDCQPRAGLCTGGCDVCSGAGTTFDCAADQGLCPASGSTVCTTCSGSGTSFSCVYDATQDADCAAMANGECTAGSGAGGARCRYWRTPAAVEVAASAATDPRVATDPSGNVLAVWRQGVSVFNAKADRYAVGVGWGTDQALETDVNNVVAIEVCTDGVGNGFAVWSQSDGTRRNIWAARYRGALATWGAAALLDTNDNGANASRVAADAAGNAAAVWYQSNGVRVRVFSARYAAGVGWGAPVGLDAANGDSAMPRIAMHAAGVATAVWMQDDGTRDSIFANRYDGAWGAAAALESGTGDADAPQVGVSQNGTVIAVWAQTDGARYNIWYNRYTTAWGTAARIASDTHDGRDPHLALDANGNAVAVWRQNDGSRDNVVASRFTAVSASWSPPVLIETNNGAVGAVGTAGGPQVTIAGDGSAVAVWPQSDGIQFNIWANRFDAAAGAWGAAKRIESAANDAMDPAITADGGGNATAIWQQGNGAANDIIGARFE
ncbi:MAG: hypothetical protein HY903_25200 [Deltaproteobacteria bacterium]|nr:hypothetical protein [Deltaproteobacteria bacterium]